MSQPTTTCPLCDGTGKQRNGGNRQYYDLAPGVCPECRGKSVVTDHAAILAPFAHSESAEESAAAEGTTVEYEMQMRAEFRAKQLAREAAKN